MPTHVFLSSLAIWFNDFDIIHFHSIDPLLFAMPALRPKIVCTSQGQAYRRAKWGALPKYASRVAERLAMKKADALIAVSRTLKQYYESKYDRKIIYIPNGAEPVPLVGENVLTKFGLTSGQYILFVGRMDPTKGCDTALEAYRKLSLSEPFVIVGGPAYTTSYCEALQRSAPKGTKFLGHLTGIDYWAVMQHAKIFVFPSEIEGLSLALLEAMACGIAIIYSNIPENQEAVQGAGLSFQVSDSEDLKLKLIALLSSSELQRRIGELARNRIHDEYSWDQITAQTISVYKQCLRRS